MFVWCSTQFKWLMTRKMKYSDNSVFWFLSNCEMVMSWRDWTHIGNIWTRLLLEELENCPFAVFNRLRRYLNIPPGAIVIDFIASIVDSESNCLMITDHVEVTCGKHFFHEYLFCNNVIQLIHTCYSGYFNQCLIFVISIRGLASMCRRPVQSL